MLVALLKPDLDSIAVSLFVHDLVEFDKYCISIRQQDPNIFSDTEARCLVYPDSTMAAEARLNVGCGQTQANYWTAGQASAVRGSTKFTT